MFWKHSNTLFISYKNAYRHILYIVTNETCFCVQNYEVIQNGSDEISAKLIVDIQGICKLSCEYSLVSRI